MTAAITLELDHDGVRLTRRLEGAEVELGSVRLDDPDFARRLAAARDAAGEAAPLPAEVVLPRSLVYFLDAATDDAVEARVANATACPVDDLVIGRCGSVAAAVERATIEEAADFARAHGFDPTAYVALPDNGAVVSFRVDPRPAPTFRSHRAATAAAAATAAPDDAPLTFIRSVRGETPPAPVPSAPAAEAGQDATAALDRRPDAPNPRPRTPGPSAAPPEVPPDPHRAETVARLADTPLARDAVAAPVLSPVNRSGVTDPTVPPAPSDETAALAPRPTVAPVDTAAAAKHAAVPPAPDEPRAPAAQPVGAAALAPLARPAGPRPPAVPPRPPAPALRAPSVARPSSDADALTVFGARRDREPERRGLRPLHAVAAVLAAGVLLAAYGVARDTAPDPDIVGFDGTATVPLDPVAEATAPPAGEDRASAPPGAEMEPATAALKPEATPQPRAPGPSPVTDAPEAVATPVPLPEAVVAGDAARPLAPVPPGERQVAAPGAFTPPPPPGTVFDMDERGLVRPTADGALTPEGVIVHAGPPTPLPPAAATGRAPAQEDSAALATAAELADAAAPTDAAVAEALTTPPAEAAAGATEPQAIAATEAADPDAAPAPEANTSSAAAPQSVAASEAADPDAIDTTEADADAAFAAAEPALPDIPAARPQPRPGSLPGSALDVAPAAPATPPVAVTAAAEDTPRPRTRPAGAASDPEAEAIAVAVASLGPAAGPDFEALAEQARAQTAAAGAGVAAAAPRAAEPPPSEPEGRSNVQVQPSAPTRGSVADRATLANAISLSRVNLIGVYGSASDRRALIRLPTGRYVKVKVGDRVDGGQVAAIQSSSVEYVKDGRRYALTLPRG